MKRGSSGATITVKHDTHRVFKSGDTRVAAQGEWLQSLRNAGAHKVLPYVFTVSGNRYEMEILREPVFGFMDADAVLRAMVESLERDIWSQGAVITDVDHRALARKLLVYTQFTEVSDRAWTRWIDVRGSLDWPNLRRCLTHGDPTWDNVMFDDNGRLKIVDPLPATSAVPDVRAVDTGKILQSCLGWEVHRYGDVKMSFATPTTLRTFVNEDREWLATVYFAVLHLLRTLPYVESAATRVAVGRMIDEALLLL